MTTEARVTGSPGTTETEKEYPGVKPAQAFILPSYQWMLARVDAVDARLQAFVSFVATVTLGVPALARALRADISFRSGWLCGALLVALAIVILGVIYRARGSVVLLSPEILYGRWLHWSEWEFNKNLLYWAGQHFGRNNTLVNRKAAAYSWMTVLFVLEAALLLVWLGAA